MGPPQKKEGVGGVVGGVSRPLGVSLTELKLDMVWDWHPQELSEKGGVRIWGTIPGLRKGLGWEGGSLTPVLSRNKWQNSRNCFLPSLGFILRIMSTCR